MQVMRITRGRVKPGTWDQFEAVFTEINREIGRVAGLVSRSLARSSDDPDVGYAISIWENTDAMRKYEASDLPERVQPRVEPFFTGDYQADHCEVRYWDAAFDRAS